MKLEFDAIHVVNFGSFVGTHELRLADSVPSLNLVRGRNKIEPRLGSNGAGKSTLLNALCWCLYEKTSNDLASTDIRPWHGKGKTSVGVSFHIDDQGHEIVRTAGPNSIKLNDKPVLQPEINKLLGLSFDVFRQTILLGQGRPLFHDLPNREKLYFLSDVLDLDRWKRYSDKANDLITDLAYEQANADADHRAAVDVSKQLSEQVAKQQAEFDVWAKDRMTKFKAAEKAVKKLTTAVKEIDTKLSHVISRMDVERLNLKLADSDVDKAHEIYQAASLELVERRSGLASLGKLREEAEQKLKELIRARTCPTCGQPIKKQANYLKNKAHVEKQIKEYLDDAAELDIDTVSARAAEMRRALNAAGAHYDKTKQLVDHLETERDFFASSKADEEVKLRVAKKELESVSTSDNPFRQRLTDLKSAHKDARKKAADTKALFDKLEARIARRHFWVKAFKDIRLFVLQDVLRELELVTNSMLDSVGLVGWQVGFDIERETKRGTIQKGLVTSVVAPNMKDGASIKWSSWSGGESQRLRLVGALALSEVLLARAGVECNVEILDEPTKGLSTEGVEDICEFLSDRSHRLGKTIWLVDHKTLESSLFDKVITVSKTKNGSTLSPND